MGWLSRIFTGSRRDHTKRQYHGNCSVYRVGNDFCNSSDEESNNEEEREEVDTRGNRSDSEEESEDEQLSRTSQDTSNNWHHDYNEPINDHGVWHHDYNEPINDHDYNEPINDHGVWHHDYNEPINNHGYSYYGTYPSQQFCYTDSIRPLCYVCKQYIPTEYMVNSFWEVEMCPSHVLDDIEKCCSCGLMEQIDTRYVTLDYGRKICLECLNFSVMSNDECEPLYLNVQEFFEGLNMKVEQEVPLLLVELQVLNDVLGVPTDSYNFRGLYLTEEQTVSTISRRPSIGADYEITDIVTEPYRLVDAVGILVLYGLPRLLLGSIIAHEMMHAWMNLEGEATSGYEPGMYSSSLLPCSILI